MLYGYRRASTPPLQQNHGGSEAGYVPITPDQVRNDRVTLAHVSDGILGQPQQVPLFRLVWSRVWHGEGRL